MEFLLGRSLTNNITNLMLDTIVAQLIKGKNVDWLGLLEQEPDPGLGNGGLGRLAACFLDSMATMGPLATGYGLRYEYGMFKQFLKNGWQEERPDHWLRYPDPWQVVRPKESVEVKMDCSIEMSGGSLQALPGKPATLFGIPRDLPIVGYGGRTINSLRLWAAGAPDFFDFQEFSHGDFVGALAQKLAAETLTRVLYPDDSTALGQALRFVQEYFLVAHFSRHEPGVFEPLRDTLLTHGDHYMHLADLRPYLDRKLVELYSEPAEWTRKAILNVAGSGKFSSDRTIAQYAREIWDVKPCPVR